MQFNTTELNTSIFHLLDIYFIASREPNVRLNGMEAESSSLLICNCQFIGIVSEVLSIYCYSLFSYVILSEEINI